MKLGRWHKFLCIAAFVFILAWCYLIGKIHSYSKIDDARHADAIVVLGASQWDGRPSPVFQARLDHAWDLYSNKLSDKIILTGGIGEGENLSEAKAGKSYLLEKGVKENNLFMEERGRTSKESLDEVGRILKDQDLDAVILVSDGFHMMRLKKMAHDLGIKASASPVKDSPIERNGLVRLKYYVRESGVYVLYLIFGI